MTIQMVLVWFIPFDCGSELPPARAAVPPPHAAIIPAVLAVAGAVAQSCTRWPGALVAARVLPPLVPCWCACSSGDKSRPLACETRLRDSPARLACETRLRDLPAKLACETRSRDLPARLVCSTPALPCQAEFFFLFFSSSLRVHCVTATSHDAGDGGGEAQVVAGLSLGCRVVGTSRGAAARIVWLCGEKGGARRRARRRARGGARRLAAAQVRGGARSAGARRRAQRRSAAAAAARRGGGGGGGGGGGSGNVSNVIKERQDPASLP
jgi:hypothetical protein